MSGKTNSNETSSRQGVVVERLAGNDQDVTATNVSTMQAFRDWFATQALRPDVQLGISSLAILFTDLRSSTQLHRLIGDASAFERILEHFDVLRRRVDAHAGALIKTIGDAIMAAFLDPAQGVAAALDILQGMAEVNRTRREYRLRLKLRLHAGPAIAVSLNERLDYFCTTVNIASRLEGQAQGDDLVVANSPPNIVHPNVICFIFVFSPRYAIIQHDSNLCYHLTMASSSKAAAKAC